MLTTRIKQNRNLLSAPATAPLGRPGARFDQSMADKKSNARVINNSAKLHPLTRIAENEKLFNYERIVKSAFDAIAPTLESIAALQNDIDFQSSAQNIAREKLGFGLPETFFADARVQKLNMKQMFAWCMFETYKRYCDDFFKKDPLFSNDEESFQATLLNCGFHTLDVSPCADGRLAHVIRYVLRLPYRVVRRKSYAGALFDIEDSLDKWVETELTRFREGKPNTAEEATRYLKAAVYHFSSIDPQHEGCAAHASDTKMAAQAGIERLSAFKEAIENTYCCGASVDNLLIGLDTDTDTIRIHVTDSNNGLIANKYIDSGEIYEATKSLAKEIAKKRIADLVKEANPSASEGMTQFIAFLLINNLSQIDYVRSNYGAHYEDAGHAEYFIGAGIGFEEVQLRNLTYFAYMNTVEEAAADLDVGIKIFTGLNISRGLPVPVVVRYDYHGNVPGAKDRAVERCHRVANALNSRYENIKSLDFLHTLLVVRDVNGSGCIEVLESSVNTQEMHR